MVQNVWPHTLTWRWGVRSWSGRGKACHSHEWWNGRKLQSAAQPEWHSRCTERNTNEWVCRLSLHWSMLNIQERDFWVIGCWHIGFWLIGGVLLYLVKMGIWVKALASMEISYLSLTSSLQERAREYQYCECDSEPTAFLQACERFSPTCTNKNCYCCWWSGSRCPKIKSL